MRYPLANFVLFVAVLPAFAIARADEPGNLAVDHLRCEYQVEPLAVEAQRPRLSWQLQAAERGQRQTAYQVLVAATTEALAADQGDLWDSGKVATDQTAHVPYVGKSLATRQRCFWKVRAWDKHDRPSPWSQPARWTMGLLEPAAWQAHWIAAAEKTDAATPLPLFRRVFDATKPVRRAEIYVCGLGFHEVHLNGRKVGDNVLEPGWTNYRKTCLYRAYDVTDQIVSGRNALGVMLGNGMYNVVGGRYIKFKGSFGPPKLILQLHLDYADGTSQVVATDKTWKTAPGPIRFSCIYGGEDYDARREIAHWDQPSCDEAAWTAATPCDGPGGRLTADAAPPIKVLQEFKPQKITEPQPGVFVYDLGQNHSGWPQLTVDGPAGATVKLVTSEVLDAAGMADQTSSGKQVWFAYTLRGNGPETWHPRFSYTGYRYVQVTGAAPQPTAGAVRPLPRIIDLTGQFHYAAADTVGQFSCANERVNQVHRIIDMSILSNLKSVLTDCPHREKLGWLEVSQLLAGGMLYNYDLATFYEKICRDMRDAQTADGLVPDIAPEYTVFSAGFRDSPEWGSAYVIAPWRIYQTYGDPALLAAHYDGMKRYVAYLGGKAKDHIVAHGLGDWADYGPNPPGESQLTSRGLTATATYYQDIAILRQVAALLGKQDDAATYARLADDVRAAFHRAFFKPEANSYDRNSQTANAMPLTLRLVPAEKRAAVLGNLVQVLRANGNRVTAGDVGFMYLVHALSDGGRGDVLYDMVTQDAGPGYMCQLKHGATTMTESWDCFPRWSQNHCMLGHAEEWFYRGLGGIRPDPAAPGYKRFVVAPQIVGDLSSANAAYRSIHGPIVSDWRRQGAALALQVTVPVNTTATVHVPAKDVAGVTEGGQPAAQAQGVKFLRYENGAALYEVGSGVYRFNSTL